MKKLIITFLLLLLPSSAAFPNPVRALFFSEFMFDSTGWAIELDAGMLTMLVGNTLDGMALRTKLGTFYFKDSINLDTQYFIVRNKDINGNLLIGRLGDKIELLDREGDLLDWIIYGTMEGSMIDAPPVGWSIYSMRDNMGNVYWCFDTTPTMGKPNDSSGSFGSVEGTVSDTAGNPISNAQVIYGYSGILNISVYTNTAGRYRFDELARRQYVYFRKNGYNDEHPEIQIYPDSTVRLDVIMHAVVGVDDENPARTIRFSLSQNYPNPFNPSTVIRYNIQSGSNVALKLFDVLGNEIATLINSFKPAGFHKFIFNVSSLDKNLAGGVYFYRLITIGINSGKTNTLTRKMIYLK